MQSKIYGSPKVVQAAILAFIENGFRPTNSNISFGNNGLHEVKYIGTILIKRLVNRIWYDGRIKNDLYVLNLKKRILNERLHWKWHSC